MLMLAWLYIGSKYCDKIMSSVCPLLRLHIIRKTQQRKHFFSTDDHNFPSDWQVFVDRSGSGLDGYHQGRSKSDP